VGECGEDEGLKVEGGKLGRCEDKKLRSTSRSPVKSYLEKRNSR